MARSRIEWTETTWNPVTGCSKISAGCKHCYAEVMSKRLAAMGIEKYKNAFGVSLHEGSLEQPAKWKKPRLIFVNSMSDLLHPDVDDDFIYRVFDVMVENSRHRFQVLTKRPERLASLRISWSPNIWMGVSVENQRELHRIPKLVRSTAAIKFLSLEPLLGPLESLPLDGIDWVIVGGESGPGARPMEEKWALSIRDQCEAENIPFFFKQWGGVNKKRNGRVLDGKVYDAMPTLQS